MLLRGLTMELQQSVSRHLDTFPAFHAAAKVLRAQGHHVENPAEINAETPCE